MCGLVSDDRLRWHVGFFIRLTLCWKELWLGHQGQEPGLCILTCEVFAPFEHVFIVFLAFLSPLVYVK